jgi:DNA-directed RNA polymerase subunit RPC12/RpoP
MIFLKSLLQLETIEEDLKIVCSWCQKDMGTKPAEKTGTTHSICPTCKEKELSKLKDKPST